MYKKEIEKILCFTTYKPLFILIISKMCTRGTMSQTEVKRPHGPSAPESSSVTSLKGLDIGPYGPYNEPLLQPSKDMQNIVGDMLSMAGGVAAVLLQIAVCKLFSRIISSSISSSPHVLVSKP